MRGILVLLSAVIVLALGYWTYSENYKTRDRIHELRSLQRELVMAQARLELLHDEWAYLNRPDRLRVLIEINEKRLGLLPMNPDHFGQVADIPFPQPPEVEVGDEGAAPQDGEAGDTP